MLIRSRAIIGFIGSCLALGAAACAAPRVAPAGSAATTGMETGEVFAFVNATVIPMDRERVLPAHTVLVRDGRITAVGPSASVRVPTAARVVNASGRFLIPGLAEMHAHIPPPQAGEETIERTLFLYLSNGVTTIRGMLGNPAHLELRERAARHEILSPRIYTSGPSVNGNSAPTPEAGIRLVEEQRAAGYDLVKLHPGLSRETFDAVAGAARQAGMPFAGHVSAAVGLDRTLEARQSSIDHLDGYVEALAGRGGGFSAQEAGFFGYGLIDEVDLSRLPGLAAATRAAGVWNAPTQSLIEHLMSDEDAEQMARRPEMRYVPEATVRNWVQQKRNLQQQPTFTRERADRYLDVRRRIIHALHAAGAGLILGSDAPQWWNVPGFSIQHELRMMVGAGLTPYQALETGTRNPAVHFGSTEFGTIQVGRAADLVLLDGDPLADIRHTAGVAGVMVRGRWLPRDEIQRRLDAIAQQVR